MGGRVAEELIFGHDKVTTGASSDISHATSMARKMVISWGMSEKMGPLSYGDSEQNYLGQQGGGSSQISDKTAQDIDDEVRRFVDDAYAYATKTLKKHHKELKLIAENLIEYETLSGDEITDLINGKKIDRSDPKGDSAVKPRASTPIAGIKPLKAVASKKKAAAKKTTAKPKKSPTKKTDK
jgi:cell division protease FtsH